MRKIWKRISAGILAASLSGGMVAGMAADVYQHKRDTDRMIRKIREWESLKGKEFWDDVGEER